MPNTTIVTAPDGGSARDAQHVGLGERVAQERLKGAAAESEGAADEPGQYGARQPQLEQDRPRGGVVAAREGAPEVAGADSRRAEGHAEGERGHDDQREDGEAAGGVNVHCAGSEPGDAPPRPRGDRDD